MSALRTLRAKPVETLFFALLAVGSLVPTVCVVGLVLSLPVFAVLVDRVLVAAERTADDAPTRTASPRLFATGTAALACVATPLLVATFAACAVGVSLTEAFSRLPWWGASVSGLAGVAAGVATAVIFAPLAYVPFAAADRRLALVPAVVRGLEIAARDRRGALSRTAALAALALVGPPMVVAVIDVQADGDDALGMATAVLLVPCLAIATAMIASRYVAVRRNAPPPDAAQRLAPVLRGAFALMPVAAALVLGAAAWAEMTPSLAPRDPPVAARGHPQEVALSGADDALVFRTYLHVRAVPGGIRIATPDGGGAGAIRCASFAADELASHASVEVTSDSVVLHVSGRPGDHASRPTCIVHLDRSGVRLDDDLLDRLERGSWLFPLGVWLALFGFLWLVADAVRHAIDARVLAAADLTKDDAGGGLRALEGTVVGGSSARMLEVAGGELRFALPRSRAFEDGARITVMARFVGSLAVGTRESARALPRGARVVVGGADEARRFLVEQASRSAVVATLVVIAGSVFAAVALIVPLLNRS